MPPKRFRIGQRPPTGPDDVLRSEGEEWMRNRIPRFEGEEWMQNRTQHSEGDKWMQNRTQGGPPRQPGGVPTREDLVRMQSGSPRVGRPTQPMQRPTLPMGFGDEEPQDQPDDYDMPANRGGRGIPEGTRSKKGGMGMAYLAPLLSTLVGGLVGKATGSGFGSGAKAGLQFGAGFGKGMIEEKRHQEVRGDANRDYNLALDKHMLEEDKLNSTEETALTGNMQFFLESWRNAVKENDASGARGHMAGMKATLARMDESGIDTTAFRDMITNLPSAQDAVKRSGYQAKFEDAISKIQDLPNATDARAYKSTLESLKSSPGFMEYAHKADAGFADVLGKRITYLDELSKEQKGVTAISASGYYTKLMQNSEFVMTPSTKTSLEAEINADALLQGQPDKKERLISEVNNKYIQQTRTNAMMKFKTYSDRGMYDTPEGESVMASAFADLHLSYNTNATRDSANKIGRQAVANISRRRKEGIQMDLLKTFGKEFLYADAEFSSDRFEILNQIADMISPPTASSPQEAIFRMFTIANPQTGENLNRSSKQALASISSLLSGDLSRDREDALNLLASLKTVKTIYSDTDNPLPDDLMEAMNKLAQRLGVGAGGSPPGQGPLYNNPYRRPFFQGGGLTPQGEGFMNQRQRPEPPPSEEAPTINIDADPMTGQIFPQRQSLPVDRNDEDEPITSGMYGGTGRGGL